jgi:hypothetical protein
MNFGLTGVFAVAAVLLGFLAWIAFADAAEKGARIDALKQEAEQRERIETADDRSRIVSGAGREEIEAILRDFVRENAVAPVSAACRDDPAIERAYGAIGRMRDAHTDALRAAPGGVARKVRGPQSNARPGG